MSHLELSDLNARFGAERGGSAASAPQSPQLYYDGVVCRPGPYFEEPSERAESAPSDAEIERGVDRLNRIAGWFFTLFPIVILVAAVIALVAAGAGGN